MSIHCENEYSSVLMFWCSAIGQWGHGTAQVILLKPGRWLQIFCEVFLIYARQEWALTYSPVFCFNVFFFIWNDFLVRYSKFLATGSSGKSCSIKLVAHFLSLLCCMLSSVHHCMLYCRTNMPSPSSIKSTAILQRKPQWKTDETGSCGSLVSK